MPVSMVTNKNKSEYVTIIIYPLSLKGRTALPYCYGILSLLNITYFLFGVNKIGMADIIRSLQKLFTFPYSSFTIH